MRLLLLPRHRHVPHISKAGFFAKNAPKATMTGCTTTAGSATTEADEVTEKPSYQDPV
jgi:hypothetical protein